MRSGCGLHRAAQPSMFGVTTPWTPCVAASQQLCRMVGSGSMRDRCGRKMPNLYVLCVSALYAEGMIGNVWEFAETLPEQCPPNEATPLSDAVLIRLAKKATPTLECFSSHAARGLPIRGDVDPCCHASCSFFEHDEKGEQLNAMRLLPRFKNFTHAFLLSVGPEAGLALVSAKKHVDLWMFKSFNPVAAVTTVQAM